MNKMKQLSLVVGAVLVFMGVVAAQQPPAAEQKPSEAQVLEQLRGAAPTSPQTTEPPSLQVILQRYSDMVKAAQAIPAPKPAPVVAPKPNTLTEGATIGDPPDVAPAPTTRSRSAQPEELATIIKELRVLLSRLEAFAEGR
jgi:hypothetical protein